MTSEKKKTIYKILFGVGTLIIILLVIFWNKLFPAKEKCPNGADIPADGDCSKVMTQKEIDDYDNAPKTQAQINQSNGIPPAPGTTTKEVLDNCLKPKVYIRSEDFPLKTGIQGENVKTVQRKVGVPVDGKYGCITETAVWKKYGVLSITEDFFNNNINV